MTGWLRLWLVWTLGVLAVMGFGLYVSLAGADGSRLALVRDALGGFVFLAGAPLAVGYAVAWVRRGFSTTAKP